MGLQQSWHRPPADVLQVDQEGTPGAHDDTLQQAGARIRLHLGLYWLEDVHYCERPELRIHVYAPVLSGRSGGLYPSQPVKDNLNLTPK